MKKAVVLGLGLSGEAAMAFLARRGVEAVGFDDNRDHNPPLPPFEELDALILSPGVPPDHPLVLEAREKGVPLIGEAELACRALKGRAVGITGTNGKTTVTLLTTAVLNEAGMEARALGNVGVPLTAAVDDLAPEEIAVIELSSYQLETMTTRCLDASVLLNITPDHLDRYSTLEAYAAAKLRIQGITRGPCHIKSFPDVPLPDGVKGIDAENARAAFALASHYGAPIDALHRGLGSFCRPPHRMETIASTKGITFINDSKATNVAAVVKAVEKLDGPIVLIAGGRDKHSSYEPWRGCFADKVAGICLIGEAAARIERELDGLFAMKHCTSLKEAVDCAQRMLGGSGTVLLSPGCSSFDMFESFEARGEMFRTLVEELAR